MSDLRFDLFAYILRESKVWVMEKAVNYESVMSVITTSPFSRR